MRRLGTSREDAHARRAGGLRRLALCTAAGFGLSNLADSQGRRASKGSPERRSAPCEDRTAGLEAPLRWRSRDVDGLATDG